MESVSTEMVQTAKLGAWKKSGIFIAPQLDLAILPGRVGFLNPGYWLRRTS